MKISIRGRKKTSLQSGKDDGQSDTTFIYYFTAGSVFW